MRALTVSTLLVLALASAPTHAGIDTRLQPYLDALQSQGKPPLDFVLEKLDEVDLILFDDAWHPAAEPFEFYQELLRTPAFQQRVGWIFLEVIPLSHQVHLDRYLASSPEDRTLLYPAFQDDLGGRGWPLQSYFDLLHEIWTVNQELSKDSRLRAIAVNASSYWQSIQTPTDLAQFRKSLMGNDYTMYRVIKDELDGFSGDRKGVFLTNTRHAYKGIRDLEGRLFWNAGTFLHQRHPGKTYSIRFHNMALSIQEQKPQDSATPQTTAGLEKYDYEWVRMADGLWDSAFASMGNEPVAIPLKGNVFGSHPYIGNHMHQAAPDQTMLDANDAIIFLAPLEQLHNAATVEFIFTPEFRHELARRYAILYTPAQIQLNMDRTGVESLEALIDQHCEAEPRELIPQAESLPPRDAWRD